MPQQTSQDLEAVLPHYLKAQRWFRAKARTISAVSVVDRIQLKTPGSSAVIIEVRYAEGEPDVYLLPVLLSQRPQASEADVILTQNDGTLYNALIDPSFRSDLLDAIGCDEEFTGNAGSLVTVRTNAFDRQCGQWVPELESKVSRAEQSNTSIIFGDRYILKLFRKLESGINPDIEIGKFLTEAGFTHSPAVLGGIEYRRTDGDVMHAGILQAFVPNQGDAWKYTLDTLETFYGRVLKGDNPPSLLSRHPFDLLDAPSDLIGEYAQSARLLGERTAEMHTALASSTSDPDFAPEPFTKDFAEVVRREMMHEADRAFSLLKDKLPDAEVLRREPEIRGRLTGIAEQNITTKRIRHHGDYHLGQVLFTGSDFVIIDFEGEPARDLAARRLKTLAMRDVAGMIRSFSYAAYAALPSSAKGNDWAEYWAAIVGAQFLRAYLSTAGHASFAGADTREQRVLFDAFVLQKALYEVSYELNNRPDWVQIPLRGILTLIDQNSK